MKSSLGRYALAWALSLAFLGCKAVQKDGETDENLSSVAGAGNGKTLSLVGSGKLTTHYCSALNALPPRLKQWYNPAMGPGHFSCTQFNGRFNDSQKQTGLYIALSDQIKEINTCWDPQCSRSERPCGNNPIPGSDCSAPNGKFCGKQVRISCHPERGDQNCNKNAQALVVTVTDFCPAIHPDRKSGQTPPFCGDGQTVADLSDWVWDHFRAPGNENNLKLTFEKVGW